MSRYYDSVHLASDQKDLLISQLKAEIFEIQQRDKDYLALRDQLHNIQSKYRHLQDEKVTFIQKLTTTQLLQDNDFRGKHEGNAMSIMALKKEIDDLRFLLNEKSRVNNDYQQEIAANRDQINRKEGDITGIQRDLAHKSDQGYQIRKDIDNLSYEVSKLKEEKLKDLDEIARLRELSAYRERENGDQAQRIRGVDYDLLKNQERASELGKLAESKEFDLRRTSEALDSAQIELARLKDESQRLQGDNLGQQRQYDRQNEEKVALLRQRDLELQKNRELSALLFDLESKNRSRDDQVIVIRKELDDVKFSNSSIHDRNSDLRAEIAALQQHIAVLENQNKELNRELEKFVETDEQIRTTLNRRERVVELRQKTEHELHKSMYDLERSSPQRRYR
ncbi:UNKNOWN [Stylonychia lemnae]|uniref:Uncharacterized protein n=1 Tax=Stylonychia lemnae TaxID=5949 RepID=A0A078A4I5_STYLE|nr:UNKNOWN [Stylonychia lemnae]|eukprot:CDW75674.1 UNKNOWN [Stylonychia lemnae]